MKIKAFIIPSPFTKNHPNYLPGVERDVINYYNFLTSILGGSWHSNEVDVLPKNSSSLKIMNVLRSTRFDYVVTIFSGHGGINVNNGKNFLNINEREIIYLNQLTANSPKQLAIIDSCSTFENIQVVLESQFIGDPFGYVSSLTPLQARALFNDRVQKSNPGWAVMYSASPGQLSIDTPFGGAFSLSLLESTRVWGNDPENGRVLPINVAHAFTKDYLKRNFETIQTPKILHSELKPNFPFAIK